MNDTREMQSFDCSTCNKWKQPTQKAACNLESDASAPMQLNSDGQGVCSEHSDNFTYDDVTITDDEMGDFTFYRIIKPDGSSMGDIHSEDDAAMLVELLNRG